ncbi:zinc ribbon domain-containing protein [Paraburkholderia sp. BL10I2N1]|uniref:Zn-ribbon domain-containing OB-fold protein n=1 Tax=Paraburkholderia sp. BL10I2N1 TaxID=1938796 RepID=UPI00105F7429|nr:zinc ribbon domain-containing protein [Paraburkholderia sp. BL10I2N1]TDN61639.1 hypothetical protein B0G77_5120 [Paraburkholderia sp. BL10I2N1]
MTLKVFQCRQCGTTLFPARYFCPACGGGEWDERVVEHGTVAEATIVHHRVGVQEGSEVHLASVATDAGPIVIARLERATQAGDRVRLEIDEARRILAQRI